LKRKIKAARPIITGIKNHGNFFGFPAENKESSSLRGFIHSICQTSLIINFNFANSL